MSDVQFARNNVDGVSKLGKLSSKQQRGIALILSGCAVSDVARRLGVSRGTVYNWTHRNERFKDALESWQRDMASSARVRLLAMSGAAARAITVALEKGDAKVALAVFKGLGAMEPGRREEPEEVRVIRVRKVDREPKAITGIEEAR